MEHLTLGTAAAAGGLLAGASYLNAKYSIGRDLSQLWADRKWRQRFLAKVDALGDHTTIYHMMELCNPEDEALWFEGRSWSYDELRREVDAFAEILWEHGVRAGDFVALMMTNTPEMVIAIVALAKVGAAPAMVNTALRHHTLLHCLSVVRAQLVISTPDHTTHLFENFDEPGMPQHILSVNLGSFPGLRLDPDVDSSGRISHVHPGDLALASTRNSFTSPKRDLTDVFCLIYTSGTSGKPKAVSVKNNQLVIVSVTSPIDANNPKKYFPLRTYSCLPLFHGTCLFTALCYSFGNSSTFCLGRKFSASTLSHSLVECRATRMLYVGELCRYILKAPPSPNDTLHTVICAAGNGLAGDVWTKFVTRFNIPEVREFYRSTEGIAKFDNHGSGAAMAGKVGFEGPIAHWMNNVTYLIKYDPETEMPYRDPKTGFCVRCGPGEPGEAIGRVMNLKTLSDYLNNPEANEKKLIRDVFQKGDLFQRMGDLLVRNKDGWITFLDRVGDTYRWQGENVSAGEVKEHISRLPEVQDTVVYGVKLPGYDGQCGTATITLHDHRRETERDFAAHLYRRLRESGLTTYQIPRMLRFLRQMELNATFKYANASIKQRSWDPDEQPEDETVWWLDGETYRPMERENWAEIKAGKARL